MNKDRIDIGEYSIFPMQYRSGDQWFTQYALIKEDGNEYHEMFYDPVALLIKLAQLGLLVKR